MNPCERGVCAPIAWEWRLRKKNIDTQKKQQGERGREEHFSNAISFCYASGTLFLGEREVVPLFLPFAVKERGYYVRYAQKRGGSMRMEISPSLAQSMFLERLLLSRPLVKEGSRSLLDQFAQANINVHAW